MISLPEAAAMKDRGKALIRLYDLLHAMLGLDSRFSSEPSMRRRLELAERAAALPDGFPVTRVHEIAEAYGGGDLRDASATGETPEGKLVGEGTMQRLTFLLTKAVQERLRAIADTELSARVQGGPREILARSKRLDEIRSAALDLTRATSARLERLEALLWYRDATQGSPAYALEASALLPTLDQRLERALPSLGTSPQAARAAIEKARDGIRDGTLGTMSADEFQERITGPLDHLIVVLEKELHLESEGATSTEAPETPSMVHAASNHLRRYLFVGGGLTALVLFFVFARGTSASADATKPQGVPLILASTQEQQAAAARRAEEEQVRQSRLLEARDFLDQVEALEPRIEELASNIEFFEKRVATLPTSDEGKRFTADESSVLQAKLLLKLPSGLLDMTGLAKLRARVATLKSAAERGVENATLPGPLQKQFDRERQRIEIDTAAYSQKNNLFRSILENRPPAEASAPTLAEAMAARDARVAEEEGEKRAAALKKEEKRAAQERTEREVAARRAQATREALAHRKRELEKEASDPTLLAQFQFILGDGFCQFGTGGYVGHYKWDQPGPCSLKNLQTTTNTSTAGVVRKPVLDDFKTFVYVACGRSMDNAYRTYAANDRGGCHTFPPILDNGEPDLSSPEAKHLRTLFDKARKYAPVWAELGILRK